MTYSDPVFLWKNQEVVDFFNKFAIIYLVTFTATLGNNNEGEYRYHVQ